MAVRRSRTAAPMWMVDGQRKRVHGQRRADKRGLGISLTNHEAAESLHAATDRDATPPRVMRRPPVKRGFKITGRGSLGSNRSKFPACLNGQAVPVDAATLRSRNDAAQRVRREGKIVRSWRVSELQTRVNKAAVRV